jgi:hypothetical protein
MSHFSVIVIGNDIEQQLQPYHEFECTGDNDQYVIDVDKTEEVQEQIAQSGLQEGLQYFGLDDKQVSDESEVDREGAHKYGHAVVRDGKLIKAVDRTNPNAKWDYWIVGGRWTKYFILSDGTEVDQAIRGEIDFQAMRQFEADRARARYLKFHSIVGDVPRPKTFDAIQKHYMVNGQVDRESACNEYWSQPATKAIQAYRSDHEFSWMSTDEMQRMFDGIEVYVDAARRSAISPYAIVKDGRWFAKGEMGWFGCSADKGEQADWDREVDALLDALPSDTLLTIVDCHI